MGLDKYLPTFPLEKIHSLLCSQIQSLGEEVCPTIPDFGEWGGVLQRLILSSLVFKMKLLGEIIWDFTPQYLQHAGNTHLYSDCKEDALVPISRDKGGTSRKHCFLAKVPNASSLVQHRGKDQNGLQSFWIQKVVEKWTVLAGNLTRLGYLFLFFACFELLYFVCLLHVC